MRRTKKEENGEWNLNYRLEKRLVHKITTVRIPTVRFVKIIVAFNIFLNNFI